MAQTLGFKVLWPCQLQSRREGPSYKGTTRSSLPTAWSMKTVLRIPALPGCPTPAQGGWEEEHRRDQQWSPVAISLDLHTKEHHHFIHMGATSPGGSSALHHYNKSGVLPSSCSQISCSSFSHPKVFPSFPNSVLSGLLKNSRRALKYAIMTVRETWKGEFAKIFTM